MYADSGSSFVHILDDIEKTRPRYPEEINGHIESSAHVETLF